MSPAKPVHLDLGRALLVACGLASVAGCGDDSGGGSADKVKQKLVECGVLGEGEVKFVIEEEDACYIECFLAANCSDAKAEICFEELEDMGMSPKFSMDYEKCAAACEGTFKCDDGEEIRSEFQCDGSDDCEDGEDEEDCPGLAEFKCEDGDVIRGTDITCDGYEDCTDGSDEADCGFDYFTCKSGEKVPTAFVCDLEPDCEDGSDEHDECAKLMCGD